MTYLALTPTSRQRLDQQAGLNGTFHHTLHCLTGLSVNAAVSIEQCERAIAVAVTIGEHNGSITLRRNHRDTPSRIARFITAQANGYTTIELLQDDEDELISNMESILRRALQLGHGTYYLPLDDLEVALILHPGIHGLSAKLEGNGAVVHFRLSRDRRAAYQRLFETVTQFIQGIRLAESFPDDFAVA